MRGRRRCPGRPTPPLRSTKGVSVPATVAGCGARRGRSCVGAGARGGETGGSAGLEEARENAESTALGPR